MIVFLNGKFVAEADAVVSVFDRGFLYGDSVFETLRVSQHRCVRWRQHLERLQRGAAWLRLPIPYSIEQLAAFADQLLVANGLDDAILRLTLSRGVGPRGYSPAGAGPATLVMSLHPAPGPGPLPLWRIVTASLRLPANDPLAAIKSGNKLRHVLARAEADAAGADEALLLNDRGQAATLSSGNLFSISGLRVLTPPPSEGVLPGITRAAVLELTRQLGLQTVEEPLRRSHLLQADGVFLTSTSRGIVEIVELDGQPLSRSAVTARLQEAFLQSLAGSPEPGG